MRGANREPLARRYFHQLVIPDRAQRARLHRLVAELAHPLERRGDVGGRFGEIPEGVELCRDLLDFHYLKDFEISTTTVFIVFFLNFDFATSAWSVFL